MCVVTRLQWQEMITHTDEPSKQSNTPFRVKDMDAAIQKGFLDKLRLFVQVQVDGSHFLETSDPSPVYGGLTSSLCYLG